MKTVYVRLLEETSATLQNKKEFEHLEKKTKTGVDIEVWELDNSEYYVCSLNLC